MIGSDHSGEIQTEATTRCSARGREMSPACVGLTLAGLVQRLTDLYPIPSGNSVALSAGDFPHQKI
jgi:hypothetical protein